MRIHALIAIALPALMLTGCTATKTDEKITVELDTAEAKAKAREAGQEIRAGAQQAGAAMDASKQELDIRTALAMDETIDRSQVSVSADAATRSVFLRGSVPVEDQRVRVEGIAKDKAEGWTIVNELVIAPALGAPAGVSFEISATAVAPPPPPAPGAATASAP